MAERASLVESLAEQLELEAPEPAPDINVVVEDMLARYAAHTISERYSRDHNHAPVTQSICSCGWSSPEPTRDLRLQWDAVDAHLLPVLPEWERGVCWCGRAMLLTPFGRWTHAADTFMGHAASPPPEAAKE